ncbi:MAG: signal peptidase II [Microbacteriaceae bacterium]
MKIRLAPLVAFVLAAVWLVVDQLTKVWAEQTLTPGVGVPLIGDLIQWRLVYNPGAAFGLGTGYTWILTIIAGLASVALLVIAARTRTLVWAIAVGSMLGGAVSHFGDRLLRGDEFAQGKIVDFIDYAGYFVGNVADIALVGAAAFAILLSFFGVPFTVDARPEPETAPREPADPEQ